MTDKQALLIKGVALARKANEERKTGYTSTAKTMATTAIALLLASIAESLFDISTDTDLFMRDQNSIG